MSTVDFSVTPLVFRTSPETKKVTIHPKQEHAKRLLSQVTTVRFFAVDCEVEPGWANWLRKETFPFCLCENGDLTVDVNFPTEDEYVILLQEKIQGTEEFRELCSFSVYAVDEDLFRFRPFKGDFHMHSFKSDGRQSPEYVAASCRKIGDDFMALTDHGRYAPSLQAMEFLKPFDLDMLSCPGEEVHLPENPVHIIHFGGNFSINDLAKDGEGKVKDEFTREIDQYSENMGLPENLNELTRKQVTVSEWAFDKIRAAGGIAMFCHPYWRPCHHNYIGEKTIDLLMERNRFDVLEVFGGYGKNEVESNMLSLARYEQERVTGKKIPVAGVSDAHTCNGSLFSWYYTIVFSEQLTFDAIAEAIRSDRSIAVHALPGEHPIVAGPYRLCKYTYFLLREYFPNHDELCRVEGEILLRYLAGDEPQAKDLLKMRKGTVPAYTASCWEK